VTVVDLDPAVVELATTDPVISDLNQDSFQDPRVEVVNTDAFQWLRENQEAFDVVIADLPDGMDVGTSKLYTAAFYSSLDQGFAPRRRLLVRAVSAFVAPDSCGSVGQSLGEAGLAASPDLVDVTSL